MIEFCVLIPARLASVRLPDKPLADIHGVPMIVHVARAAARSGAARVAVATDSRSIVSVVREHGFEAVLTRDDHVSGTDRLAEASTALGIADDDVVVNLQGDEPLMPADVIRAVAQAVLSDPECAIATAAHPIHSPDEFRNPNVVKVVCDARGRALYFSRACIPWRQGTADGVGERLPDQALRHIGIYGYRAGYLRRYPTLAPGPLEQIESLEQLRALWHGHRIVVQRIDVAPPGGVDTPADLERVRDAMRSVLD